MKSSFIIVLSALLVFFLVTAEAEEIDFNQLAEANSRYAELNDKSGRSFVWTILQARLLKNKSAVGGFMGTAWIIEVTNKDIIFVTAKHVMEDAFKFKDKNLNKGYVFLANSTGYSCKITKANLTMMNNDVAFIKVGRKELRTKSKKSGTIFKLMPENHLTWPYPPEISSVTNLGFPDRAQRKQKHLYGINIDPPETVTFKKGPWFQVGKILAQKTLTVNALDVHLTEAKAIILDYTSERGFSGGPLLSNKNSIIGMIIMVAPPREGQYPTESVALDISEVMSQFGKFKTNGK